MRYQSALVLSTLAVGQAAAANARHASFHARRQAEAKRNMQDIDWNHVAREVDLSGVNWATVDWSSVFATPTPAPTPAQAQAAEVPASSAEPTSQKAAVASAEAPKETGSSDKSDKADKSDKSGNVVTDVLQGVESLVKKLGVKTGKNAKSSGEGSIWIGGDSKWTATFINDADDDAVLFCWTKEAEGDPYGGMFLGKYTPAISAGIPGGQSLQLSFAESVPCVCAPAYSDTALNGIGQVDQSWVEMNFVSGHGMGAFDVSREINMSGNVISAKGSMCTSGVKDDKLSCVFGCTASGANTCGAGGGDYAIFGGEDSGCMVGKDPSTQDASGGCGMGADGESLTVTLYGSKSWPSA